MSAPLCVLIVEDSEDDTLLLMRELRRGGYDLTYERVDTAEAMAAALDRQTWDVVLCDYAMPHFSAPDALKLLKERELDLPFIMVSGAIGEETAVEAMKAGVHDYIMKGNLTRLIPAIERELREAEGRQEHKHAEDALKESEQRFRSLSENAPDIIYTLGLEGSFTYVNPAWEKVLGHKRGEVIGKNFVDFAREEDAAHCLHLFKRVREGQETFTDASCSLIHKDGSVRLFSVSGAPNLDSEGKVIGVVGVFKDITEQRKLESQLIQAQKMEAIGTLAGGIAHDFNNILGIILGNTELVLDDIPESNPAWDDLEEVRKACLRAKDLVGQLLTFTRQREQERRAVQISPIVKETLKLLRAFLPATTEIRQNIETHLDTVLADPTQIHQVLMNLCTNAAHAMRAQGGVLEVSLTDVQLDSDAVAPDMDLSSGPYVRLSVSDTGCGIDPEVMDRMFDPYFTTKEPGEGTGMGLAVVHGIIKGLGGMITVDSELGKGTTFHVFFPRIESDVIPETEAPAPLSRGTERILFVDDEEAMVKMAKKMLERLGYEAVARTSPVEALEAFRAHPDSFDLVITDQTMSNMTGEMLAKELMAVRPDIPIILCTGFSEVISEEKAKANGIREFIMKPISTRQIAETIQRVLGKN
ncbi:MAG: response regulator [Deltaproteobacteria bacterium]|nr:response regulator [Deltaproteobacteria bacterium]MBW2020452.1 response regulator [Deltaproteobacteria bacterium]MBW2074939.1 response regulator [Deltaproteobacteria bacterium]